MVLRGIKEISWKAAKGMMSEANFLKGLMEMDVDGITPAQVKRFLYLYIIAYYSINFETYEFRLRQIFHILNAVKLV